MGCQVSVVSCRAGDVVDGASIEDVDDVGPRFPGARGEDKVGDDKLLFLSGVGVVHTALWIARDWA